MATKSTIKRSSRQITNYKDLETNEVIRNIEWEIQVTTTTIAIIAIKLSDIIDLKV